MKFAAVLDQQPPDDHAPDQAVRICPTGVDVVQAGQDVILRSALRAGFGFPYECNTGTCGCCKFELLDGQVEVERHDAIGWTQRDRSKSRYLGCQTRAISPCRIRVAEQAAARPAIRPRQVEVELVGMRDLTHDLREFTFAADEPARFLPGQYALLRSPAIPDYRCYSMANLPNDAGTWQFIVRRIPLGIFSARMFALPVGSRLSIDGPYGHAFFRSTEPQEIVCIAGGSGLAPMLSIARATAATGHRVHFYYGGRQAIDMDCTSELRALPGFGSRVTLECAISADGPDVANSWSGRVGMLHEIVKESLSVPPTQVRAYLAGAPPMLDAALGVLVDVHGVPADRVHFDRFV